MIVTCFRAWSHRTFFFWLVVVSTFFQRPVKEAQWSPFRSSADFCLIITKSASGCVAQVDLELKTLLTPSPGITVMCRWPGLIQQFVRYLEARRYRVRGQPELCRAGPCLKISMFLVCAHPALGKSTENMVQAKIIHFCERRPTSDYRRGPVLTRGLRGRGA